MALAQLYGTNGRALANIAECDDGTFGYCPGLRASHTWRPTRDNHLGHQTQKHQGTKTHVFRRFYHLYALYGKISLNLFTSFEE